MPILLLHSICQQQQGSVGYHFLRSLLCPAISRTRKRSPFHSNVLYVAGENRLSGGHSHTKNKRTNARMTCKYGNRTFPQRQSSEYAHVPFHPTNTYKNTPFFFTTITINAITYNGGHIAIWLVFLLFHYGGQ